MDRREFVQLFVANNANQAFQDARNSKEKDFAETCHKAMKHLVVWANDAYDLIESNEKVREDNSMADTRPYLNALNGASQ